MKPITLLPLFVAPLWMFQTIALPINPDKLLAANQVTDAKSQEFTSKPASKPPLVCEEMTEGWHRKIVNGKVVENQKYGSGKPSNCSNANKHEFGWTNLPETHDDFSSRPSDGI